MRHSIQNYSNTMVRFFKDRKKKPGKIFLSYSPASIGLDSNLPSSNQRLPEKNRDNHQRKLYIDHGNMKSV